MVTIYGEIGTVDRGAMDPDVEPLFDSYGIHFDAAYSMSFAGLDALMKQNK